jgi:hypothetical protein
MKTFLIFYCDRYWNVKINQKNLFLAIYSYCLSSLNFQLVESYIRVFCEQSIL